MITDPGKKVRQIRELKNYTQEYVASMLGISTRAFSKIESEETQLTIKRLNEISAVLEVSPMDILCFEAERVLNYNPEQQTDNLNISQNRTEIDRVINLYENLIAEKDRLIVTLENQLMKTNPE